jgi:glucose/mannose transport system substrate-binding protein
LIGASLTLSVGCGSSADSAGSGGTAGAGGAGGADAREHNVVLYSWWTNPGEAESLQALVDAYKVKFPGAGVNNVALSVHGQAEALLDQTIDSSPPDIFQYNGYKMKLLYTAHPAAIANTDFIFEEPGLMSTVIGRVVDSIKIDGHAYGVPTGIHRENSIFYNSALFAQYKIARPSTMQDVLAACATFKAANVTCIAAAGQSWIADKMWVVVLQSTMGADLFKEFITQAKPLTDPTIQAGLSAAADTFQTITQQYIDRSHLGDTAFGWNNAAYELFQGKAAIYMHGDWVKGYLVQLGWTPGTDFEQGGPPGATDIFYYGVDVFGLTAVGPNGASAHDFLGVVASKEGQAAFNKLKGSTPMRTDARALLDPLGQRNLDDLVGAKLSMAVVDTMWGDEILAFAQDGDKAKFLAAVTAKGFAAP